MFLASFACYMLLFIAFLLPWITTNNCGYLRMIVNRDCRYSTHLGRVVYFWTLCLSESEKLSSAVQVYIRICAYSGTYVNVHAYHRPTHIHTPLCSSCPFFFGTGSLSHGLPGTCPIGPPRTSADAELCRPPVASHPGRRVSPHPPPSVLLLLGALHRSAPAVIQGSIVVTGLDPVAESITH